MTQEQESVYFPLFFKNKMDKLISLEETQMSSKIGSVCQKSSLEILQ